MAAWNELAHEVWRSIPDRELTTRDEQILEDADYSEEALRDLFDEAFLTHTVDSELTSDERQQARYDYFEWMEYLGYDSSDFDWHSWREYMGYND